MEKPRAPSPVLAVQSPSRRRGLKRKATHIFPEVNIVEYGSLSPDEDQGIRSPDLQLSKRFVSQTATASPPQERRRVIRTPQPRPHSQTNNNIETLSQRSHGNINRDLGSDIPTRHQDLWDILGEELMNVRLDDVIDYKSLFLKDMNIGLTRDSVPAIETTSVNDQHNNTYMVPMAEQADMSTPMAAMEVESPTTELSYLEQSSRKN